MDLSKIMSQEGTTIVDVRESFEFIFGHAKNAVNIPLGKVSKRIEEFKNMSGPIVVYCRSGMRSGQAQGILQANGIKNVYNGGTLGEVKSCQKQLA